MREGPFFLAGGTGIGLRLGHRMSRDIDWFTASSFDANALAARLMELPEKPTEIAQQGPHTLRAHYGELETSSFATRKCSRDPNSSVFVDGEEQPSKIDSRRRPSPRAACVAHRFLVVREVVVPGESSRSKGCRSRQDSASMSTLWQC